MKNNVLYCPYYCEENIWKLCENFLQKPEFEGRTTFVVFASNPQLSCAIWHLKAAQTAQEPVVFDYHVFLLMEDQTVGYKPVWQVWDLDSTLGFPVDAETYIRESFLLEYDIPKQFQPLFRVITAQDYLNCLSTDRSHMRDEDGEWLHSPPDWRAPFQENTGSNLFRFVQMEQSFLGEVLDLQTLWQRFV